MLNQWFLTLHHLCTKPRVINKESLSTFSRQFARTSPSFRLHTFAYNMSSSNLDKMSVWVPLVCEELDRYRPNLYQSVVALSPRCLACSVAPSAEGRACHRAGTGLNSFKVTLWFNGEAFKKKKTLHHPSLTCHRAQSISVTNTGCVSHL